MQTWEYSERKPPEDSTQINQLKQIIASLERDLKESHHRNDRYQEEIQYYQARVKSLEKEKSIHIKNHAVEKEELNSKVSEITRKLKKIIRIQTDKELVLNEENTKLKKEIAILKKKERKSTSVLKKKLRQSETQRSNILLEKDKTVRELDLKFKQLKQTKIPKKLNTYKNTESRPRSCLTTREPEYARLEEIKLMIAGIEKTQEQYREKYNLLIRNGHAHPDELNRLQHLLENNEERLAEAKRLRERFSSVVF